jgi:hypothetical protein
MRLLKIFVENCLESQRKKGIHLDGGKICKISLLVNLEIFKYLNQFWLGMKTLYDYMYLVVEQYGWVKGIGLILRWMSRLFM